MGRRGGGGVESWRQGPECNPERTEMDSEGFGLDGSGRAQMWLSSWSQQNCISEIYTTCYYIGIVNPPPFLGGSLGIRRWRRVTKWMNDLGTGVGWVHFATLDLVYGIMGVWPGNKKCLASASVDLDSIIRQGPWGVENTCLCKASLLWTDDWFVRHARECPKDTEAIRELKT